MSHTRDARRLYNDGQLCTNHTSLLLSAYKTLCDIYGDVTPFTFAMRIAATLKRPGEISVATEGCGT